MSMLQHLSEFHSFLKAEIDAIVGHTTFYLATHQLTDPEVICTIGMLLELLGAAPVHL